MTGKNIHKLYAQSLELHKKGHALLEPVSVDKISIGSVGYFDCKGRWEVIIRDIKKIPRHMAQFKSEIQPDNGNTEAVREFASENINILHVGGGVSLE